MEKPLLNSPSQQHMSLSAAFDKHHDGIMLKQTMKGCLRNLLNCQAQTEYTVSGFDRSYLESPMGFAEAVAKEPNTLYILEDSSCLLRCCWRDGRPLTFNVSEGGEPGGKPVVQYTKPCGMPLYCSVAIPQGGGGGGDGGDSSDGGSSGQETMTCDIPCCFMLPKLEAKGSDGQTLNKSEYLCDAMSMCVPKLMYSEGTKAVYYLAPDTCLCGCCVQPKFHGCKKVTTIPFYLRDPVTKEKITNAAGKHLKISKVWAGAKKECCSTADTFATMWPEDCDANRKAGLLGLTLLLDFTVFEKQGQAGSNLATSFID